MTDVTALSARLAEARIARFKAAAAHDSARQIADAARADLKAEFGVDTVEEAESLQRELRDRLDAEAEALSALLDEIGA